MTVGPMFFAPDGGGGGGGGGGWFQIITWTGAGAATRTLSSLDLSNGGLVWVKRLDSSEHHALYFKAASGGTVYTVATSATTAAATSSATLDSSSFTVPHDTTGATYVAWVFKNSPGNFNVFSYTGNGVSGNAVPHGLGATPKFLTVTNIGGTYIAYMQHQSMTSGGSMRLNSTASIATTAGQWNNVNADATNVTLGNSAQTNGSGTLFLGFAWGGSDVAASTYDGTGASQNVTVGFNPQFLMAKSQSTGDWGMWDTTRSPGPWTGNDSQVRANSLIAAVTSTDYLAPFTNGFNLVGGSHNNPGQTFVYLAIR